MGKPVLQNLDIEPCSLPVSLRCSFLLRMEMQYGLIHHRRWCIDDGILLHSIWLLLCLCCWHSFARSLFGIELLLDSLPVLLSSFIIPILQVFVFIIATTIIGLLVLFFWHSLCVEFFAVIPSEWEWPCNCNQIKKEVDIQLTIFCDATCHALCDWVECEGFQPMGSPLCDSKEELIDTTMWRTKWSSVHLFNGLLTWEQLSRYSLNSSWCGVQLWRLLFLQDHDFHFFCY